MTSETGYSTLSIDDDDNPFIEDPEDSDDDLPTPPTPIQRRERLEDLYGQLRVEQGILKKTMVEKDTLIQHLQADLRLFLSSSADVSAFDLAKKYIQEREDTLHQVQRLTNELSSAQDTIANLEAIFRPDQRVPPSPVLSFLAVISRIISIFPHVMFSCLWICATALWRLFSRDRVHELRQEVRALSERNEELEQWLSTIGEEATEALGRAEDVEDRLRMVDESTEERLDFIRYQVLCLQLTQAQAAQL